MNRYLEASAVREYEKEIITELVSAVDSLALIAALRAFDALQTDDRLRQCLANVTQTGALTAPDVALVEGALGILA